METRPTSKPFSSETQKYFPVQGQGQDQTRTNGQQWQGRHTSTLSKFTNNSGDHSTYSNLTCDDTDHERIIEEFNPTQNHHQSNNSLDSIFSCFSLTQCTSRLPWNWNWNSNWTVSGRLWNWNWKLIPLTCGITCVLCLVMVSFIAIHYESAGAGAEPSHYREELHHTSHTTGLQLQFDELKHTVEEKSDIIDELTTRFDKMKRTVQQNRNYITAAQRRLNFDCLFNEPHSASFLSATINKSNIVTLGCGGKINLPPVGSALLLEYKSTELYDNNERCLWIVDSTSSNGRRFDAKLNLALQCEGFGDTEDAVSIIDWIDWESLTSYGLKSQMKEFGRHKHSTWHYLSFTSNNNLNGHGFIVRLEVIYTTEPFIGLNQAFTTSSGIAAYGPNKQGDRVSMVINPPQMSQLRGNFTFTVDYLESRMNGDGTCENFDSLFIFQVGQKGASKKLARLCGNVTSRSFTTPDPILVGYLTSSSATGKGFRLSWK